MKLPSDPTKFTSQFKYVEVGHYVPSLNKLIREKDGPNPRLIDIADVSEYAERNGNVGIYTSLFHYSSDTYDPSSALGSLCFDFDSDDLSRSHSETIRMVGYLQTVVKPEAIRIFFSGGKGFHIEVEAIALNISASDDLSGVFRYIAGDLQEQLGLTTLDTVVYDMRRMWRYPNSQHQKTGLFKVECSEYINDELDIILRYAKEPHPFDVPEQHFDARSNQWYREYTYQFEQSKLYKPTSAEMMARFMEQGTSNVHLFNEEDKVFDKFKLFRGCPAVAHLVNKAETTHHLEHYERLFLCSLLTYTKDSIEYLHQVLSRCHDYNFEVSNAHIEDWVKRREYGIGGRPFTCDKARQVGISCSGCDKMEPKKKLVHIGQDKVIETEEFSSPSPVRHAYSYPRGH